MEVLTQIFVSVAAHIIGYFTCRWLDRHISKGGRQKTPRRGCGSPGGLPVNPTDVLTHIG